MKGGKNANQIQNKTELQKDKNAENGYIYHK